MKIDSGSEINVIGQDVYQQILNNSQKKITLQKSKAKLKPYNSPPSQIRGKFRAMIESRKHTATADIYVTASNNVKSILSKYSAFDMNISTLLKHGTSRTSQQQAEQATNGPVTSGTTKEQASNKRNNQGTSQ